MQQQKKSRRCTTKRVNFQNIMLGVDGKSQKTTYSLILFCGGALQTRKTEHEQCISENICIQVTRSVFVCLREKNFAGLLGR